MKTNSEIVTDGALFKRMRDRKLSLAAAMAVLIVFPMTSLEAAVIYRQTFGFTGTNPDSSSERIGVSHVGWQGYYQMTNYQPSTPVVSPIATDESSYYVGIREIAGAPTNLPNVGTPAPSESEASGAVMLYRGDNQNYQSLLFTEHFEIDLAEYRIDTISWYSAASTANINNALRAALRIGDEWYVSEAITSSTLGGNAAGNFSTSATERSVSLQGNLWYSLSAEVGGYFAIGTEALELPNAGVVEAFGMYGTTTTTNGHMVIFDSYTISATAIPEPGAMALLSGCVAIGGLTLVRRPKGGE